MDNYKERKKKLVFSHVAKHTLFEVATHFIYLKATLFRRKKALFH